MIITIPVDSTNNNTNVSDRFGRCNYFCFLNTETNESNILENTFRSGQGGVGIKASEFVIKNHTDVLIAPHIGNKAMDVLKDSSIKIYHSVPGTTNDNITLYNAGKLEEVA